MRASTTSSTRKFHLPLLFQSVCLLAWTAIDASFFSFSKSLSCSFKLWVYQWMQLGGVESEDEFLFSKRALEAWLNSFKRTGERHEAYNAEQLQTLLTKKLMPHKERWFFPLRRGKLTLNQKTTSPLEAMNGSMKANSGTKVTPNMSLCSSMMTQDLQADRRLQERQTQCVRLARARSTSIRSHTVNDVTPVCESVISEQMAQKDNYASRVVDRHTIQVKRLPHEIQYCATCEEIMKRKGGEGTCATHSFSSPIPVYLRCRTIRFIPVSNSSWYQAVCSCLFHGTIGCPCRHLACVMDAILPHHVIARHHTKFQAFFKKPDKPEITKEFHQRKNDYRLCVTASELGDVMANARRLEEKYLPKLPIDFWQDVGPRFRSQNGLVKKEVSQENECCLRSFNDQGMMSQDVFLTQDFEDSGSDFEETEDKFPQTVILSDDFEGTTKSTFNQVADMFRRSNRDPEFESKMREIFASMLRIGREFCLDKHSTDKDFTGDVVSCSIPMDKRRKFKRIKRKSEAKRSSNKSKTKKAPIRFSAGSLI